MGLEATTSRIHTEGSNHGNVNESLSKSLFEILVLKIFLLWMLTHEMSTKRGQQHTFRERKSVFQKIENLIRWKIAHAWEDSKSRFPNYKYIQSSENTRYNDLLEWCIYIYIYIWYIMYVYLHHIKYASEVIGICYRWWYSAINCDNNGTLSRHYSHQQRQLCCHQQWRRYD